MFGNGGSYTVHAVFENAGQLVHGQRGARRRRCPSARSQSIELDDQAQAVVTMEVDDDYAPLQRERPRRSGRARVGHRQSLCLADAGANNNDQIDDGGRIGTDSTAAPVDLDVLFNTLDPKTRKGLENVIRGSGTWYEGAGPEANAATKYLRRS